MLKRTFFLSLLNLYMISAIFAEDRWLPELFAENSKPQFACSSEVIRSHQFRGNEKILSLECRDGALTALMANYLPQGKILAIENSPSMINYATKKWANLKNVAFELIDPEKMQFQEEFDLVTAFFSMHWINDQEKVLKNIQTSLVPGGKALILTPYKLADVLLFASHHIMQKDKWAPYFEHVVFFRQYRSVEEHVQMLIDANFAEIRFKVRNKNIVFDSRNTFHKTLLPSLPFIDPIPPALRETFLAEIVDKYLIIIPPDKNNRVLYTIDMIEILATKKFDHSYQIQEHKP